MTFKRAKLDQLAWHRVAEYLERRYFGKKYSERFYTDSENTLIGVSYEKCLSDIMQDDLLSQFPAVDSMTQKTLVNMKRALGLVNWHPPRNTYRYTVRQQAAPVEKVHVPPMSAEKIDALLVKHVKPFLESILKEELK